MAASTAAQVGGTFTCVPCAPALVDSGTRKGGGCHSHSLAGGHHSLTRPRCQAQPWAYHGHHSVIVHRDAAFGALPFNSAREPVLRSPHQDAHGGPRPLGAPLRSSFSGHPLQRSRGVLKIARTAGQRGVTASVGSPGPSTFFRDEPSSYLPSLFTGDLAGWLPESVVAEALAQEEKQQQSSPPVIGATQESQKHTVFTASTVSSSEGERGLPSEIRFTAASEGPVPVVVQLTEETLSLFKAQAKQRPSVFMYLASLLMKGASAFVTLGGSAVISVAVSLIVLERVGVLKQWPGYMPGGPAASSSAMPKVVIRKTVKPPAARETGRDDEVDPEARPVTVTQLPEGWTQERFSKLGKDVRAADKYWNRLRTHWWKLPAEWLDAIEREVERLGRMHSMSTEHAFVLRYLDWMTLMPWGEFTQERFDVQEARRTLEEDHFALDEVKERLLEFIAVSQLKGTTQGRIILLHGPPGVGKTSIAKSMARALNRKFHRMSVGGLNDPVEFKGHNRTYVGSEPGKVVGALKQVGVMNPLILIDEVDKMAHANYRGDPGAALLEILDPEQNGDFKDHYMEVGLDLSKVLFVCTANDISQIARPLLDRMETIELSGYSTAEKVHIAKRFLLPKIKDKVGLAPDQVDITDSVLEAIATKYTFEAGCRGMERQLEKICRKIALELVDSKQAREAGQTRPPGSDNAGPSSGGRLPGSPPAPEALRARASVEASRGPVFVEEARSTSSEGTVDGQPSQGEEDENALRVRSELGAGTSGGAPVSASLGGSPGWCLEGPSAGDAKSPRDGKGGSEKTRDNKEQLLEGDEKKGSAREVLQGLWDQVQRKAQEEPKGGASGPPLQAPWGQKAKNEGAAEAMEVSVTGAQKGKHLRKQIKEQSLGHTVASDTLAEKTPLSKGGREWQVKQAGHALLQVDTQPAVALKGQRVLEPRIGLAWRGERADLSEASAVRTLEYHLHALVQAREAAQQQLLAAESEAGGIEEGSPETVDALLDALGLVLEAEEAEVMSADNPLWPATRALLDSEHHLRKAEQLMGEYDPAPLRALSPAARKIAWELGLQAAEERAEEGQEGRAAAPLAVHHVLQDKHAHLMWAREKLAGVRGEWRECTQEERHEIEAALGGLEHVLLEGGQDAEALPQEALAELEGVKALVDKQGWARTAAQGEGHLASVLRQHSTSFPKSHAEGVVLLRTWWRVLERHWQPGAGGEARLERQAGGSRATEGSGAHRTHALVSAVEALRNAPESEVAQRQFRTTLEAQANTSSAHASRREAVLEAGLRQGLLLLGEAATGKLSADVHALAAAKVWVDAAGAHAAQVDSGFLEAEVLAAEWLLADAEEPLLLPIYQCGAVFAEAFSGRGGVSEEDVRAAWAACQQALTALQLDKDWSGLESGEGFYVPRTLKTSELIRLHVAAVLYESAVHPGALPGLTYPLLTRKQGDAWNLAYLKQLTSHLLHHIAQKINEGVLDDAVFKFDGDLIGGVAPDGYNMPSLDELAESGTGSTRLLESLTEAERQQVRSCLRAVHWLRVLEGPFQDLTGWRGTGGGVEQPFNPNEGTLTVHGFLLTELLSKRARHRALFEKLEAQGGSLAQEVRRCLHAAGGLLGFSGRTPLEWALVSRKVPLLWKQGGMGPEVLLLYEEPALLRHLQGKEDVTIEAAPQHTPLLPQFLLGGLSAGESGPPGRLASRESRTSPLKAMLLQRKTAADSASRALYAAVKDGRRSAKDVLSLRLAFMQSGQLSFALEKIKPAEAALPRDTLASFDLKQATRDALGEPPVRSSGERWCLGDPLEELFVGQAIAPAGEVDMELVTQAVSFFDTWQLFDDKGGAKQQVEESSQIAAGFLEALLQITTERAVQNALEDERMSAALSTLHKRLLNSFAVRGASSGLAPVLEAALGAGPGRGGILGALLHGGWEVGDADWAVLLRAYRAALWAPEKLLKPLKETRKLLSVPGQHFADVRELGTLRKVLFEGVSASVSAPLLNVAEGGILMPLISLEELTRGKGTDRARSNPLMEKELFELLWAYLRAQKPPVQGGENSKRMDVTAGQAALGWQGHWGRLAGHALDLGLTNPHAFASPSPSDGEGNPSTPFPGCSAPRINLHVAEETVRSVSDRGALSEGRRREVPSPTARSASEASRSTLRRGGDLEPGTDSRSSLLDGTPLLTASNPDSLPGPRESAQSSESEVSQADTAQGRGFDSSSNRSEAASSSGLSSSPLSPREAQLMAEAQRTEVVVEPSKFVVSLDNLRKYLGRPKFGKERWYVHTPTGVVMGLVTTQAGGQITYIEASLISKNVSAREGSILATGQMGDVLKESTTIAHSVAARVLQEKQADNAFFEHAKIHVHMPEGSVPKDGPSAGVTLVTSLLSLAMDKPVRPNLSMTGEITLVGRVLPVGGIKEKVSAAQRAGVTTIILPAECQHAWEELADDVTAGLEVHFAETYEDVYRVAFEYPQEAATKGAEGAAEQAPPVEGAVTV